MLKIDGTKIRDAICVVNYAGVARQMDIIGEVAQECGLLVIEDAAQAHYARWRDKPLAASDNLRP